MEQLLSQLRVDDFLALGVRVSEAYPREMALGEGIILGALALSCVGLLLVALFKRSARAIIGFSFSGIGLILLAIMQNRIGEVAPANLDLLLALFAATGILFMTACVRLARDNPFLGLVLLAIILFSLMAGAGAMLGKENFSDYVRFAVLGAGLMAPALCLLSGVSGDRLAVMLFPSVLLITGAFIAARIGAGVGLDHWIGALMPMGMFSLGIIVTTWLGSSLKTAPTKEPNRVTPDLGPELGSAVAFSDATSDIDAQLHKRRELESKKAERTVRFSGSAPELSALDAEETTEPLFEQTPPVVASAREETPKRDENPKHRSPTSALWGRSVSARPTVIEESVPEIATGLKVSTENHWDWTAEGRNQLSSPLAGLLSVRGREEITPEILRGMVDEASLDAFDEAILGGAEPEEGNFSFPMALRDGAHLKIDGKRFVDEDGLVSRIVMFAERDDDKDKAAAASGPKILPVHKKEKKELAADPIPDRKQIAAQLKAALKAGEIRAHFQPIVRVSDGEIAGFEALARWHRPGAREPLPAKAFIGEAMDAGLGMDVATVIVTEAATELAAWIKEQPGKDQFVTINISADDLVNDNFAKLVKQEINKHKLPKGALVVELTESHVMENIGRANHVIKALKNAGAHIALDDFGAGHSSLSRLSKLNVDLLKTDRALLEEIGTSKDASIVLQGAIDIAHRLGLKVVAEGAETEALARTLKSLGCDFGQGYFFGAAAPATEAEEPTPEEKAAGVSLNLR